MIFSCHARAFENWYKTNLKNYGFSLARGTALRFEILEEIPKNTFKNRQKSSE